MTYEQDDIAPILAVDTLDQMGGTEEQVTRLALALRQRKHAVTLLSRWPLDRTSDYVTRMTAAGVRIVTPGWRGPGTGRLDRLQMLPRSLKYRVSGEAAGEHAWKWQRRQLRRMATASTVVHEIPFFGYTPPVASRMYERRPRLPIVHTAFGRYEGLLAHAVAPWAVMTSDSTDNLVDGLAARWIPSMGPMQELIPPRMLSPDRTIVYAGRFTRQKGLDVLLRAASRLREVSVVLAGYGEEAQNLANLAAELRVELRIESMLRGGEVLELLSRADVAVLPSLHGEGVSSFVVEALAVGVPVVASDVGALRKALSPMLGRGALLARPNDSGDLLRCLEVALPIAPDERVCADLRRYYGQAFSPSAVANSYILSYLEARERATA